MNSFLTSFPWFSMLLWILMPVGASATPPDSLAAGAGNLRWDFSVAGFYYVLPDDDDIVMLVAKADRDNLHLESRYNYEDLRTASVFAGWTFSSGEAFTIDLTPMAGVALGRTAGVVPALEASLGYGEFDFYLESEYLVDIRETSESFFYSWLELGVAPHGMLRAGLVAQRTRVAQTPLEISRGLFAQLTPDLGSVSVYAFNLFTESWLLVVGLEISW